MRLVRVHGNTTVTISVGAHRLLSDWGEGTSHALLNEGKGAASASGDATWLHTFFSTGLWSTGGGDFVAGASATRTVLLNGVYTWSSGGMVNDVLGWLDDPGSNYGWLLSGGATTRSAKGFATSENGTIANRPRLILGLGTTTTTSTTSTTSTSSSSSTTTTTTTTTSTSSTTLSPPEIVGINTNVRLWVIYAPMGTIVPRYSTNLATIPIEWLSIPSFTNIPGSGTNIFQFDPPDTNAQAVFYHILQTL